MPLNLANPSVLFPLPLPIRAPASWSAAQSAAFERRLVGDPGKSSTNQSTHATPPLLPGGEGWDEGEFTCRVAQILNELFNYYTAATHLLNAAPQSHDSDSPAESEHYTAHWYR